MFEPLHVGKSVPIKILEDIDFSQWAVLAVGDHVSPA
jgi:hypothetical protein